MSRGQGPIAFRKGAAPQPQTREWFRVDNAFQDTESSTGETTVVYIYDEIGYGWFGGTAADDFVRMLSTIKTGKIRVHINSPGGDIFDGVAIYNALIHHDAEVEIVIDALAASAASFIAMAGDKIVMTPAATMMIHDGSAGLYGFAADHREVADLLDKLSDTVAGIYTARAGGNRESWRDLMMATTWYNAEEAVAAGLADEIEGDTKAEDTEAAKNTWGKSIYNVASSSPSPHALRERILNTIKETNIVSQSAPETEQPVTPPTPQPAPPAAPAAPAEPAPAPAVPAEEEEAEPTPTPTETPAPVQPALPDNTFKPTNSAGLISFRVGGQVVTDPQAVQNHIVALETFQNESHQMARTSFVDELVRDKKVLGSEQNVTNLKNFAQSLTNDAFTAWKSTYDSAPAVGMIDGTHTGGQTGGEATPGTPASAPQASANELEIAREIVKSHMVSGVKPEQLQATASYKKLLAADPNFKLESLKE